MKPSMTNSLVFEVKISDLEQASKWINKGAKVLTTCPDVADPASKGEDLIGMPGHMIHMIKLHAPCRPYSVGKPNRFMVDRGLDIVKTKYKVTEPQQILFVGDSMDTDMIGAFEANLKMALVLTGNTRIQLLKHHIIQPDIVGENLSEILTVLKSNA